MSDSFYRAGVHFYETPLQEAIDIAFPVALHFSSRG
jgi:hypothetical protein